MRPALAAIVLLLASATRAEAQAAPCKALPPDLATEVSRAAADHVANPNKLADAHIDDLAALAALHAMAVGQVKDVLFVPVETADVSKQTGGSGRTGGVASLVEKPSFATLLALAVERGAVNADTSGNRLTLSTSLYGLAAAISGDSSVTYRKSGFLSRLGLAASFDTAAGSTDVLENARNDQIREYGVKIRLSPDRTVRSGGFERWWQENVRPVMARQNKALVTLISGLNGVPAFGAAVVAARDELNGVLSGAILKGKPEVERVFGCALQSHIIEPMENRAIQLPAELVAQIRTGIVPVLTSGSAAFATVNDSIRKHLGELAGRPTASLAIRKFRPVEGYDFLEATFAYSQRLAPLTAILNVGGSYFTDRPGQIAPIEGWRDVVIVASLQTATRSPFLRETADLSPITIAVSAGYERVFDHHSVNPLVIGTENTLVQARVELPLTLGIILPISFSMSNDPENVEEAKKGTWGKGMYFGLTFDFDKFTALTKALVAARR